MNEGAFAFLDCLGFKGIWKDVGAERVMAKLRAIEVAAERIKADGPVNWFKPGVLQTPVLFLSDTVVIGAYANTGMELNDRNKGLLVRLVAQLSCAIMKQFVIGDLPRAIRGCISYGQFAIDRTFIVGPAVDEAATNERLAQGAFVWLSPMAAELYDKSTQTIMRDLKQGQLIDIPALLFNMIRLNQGLEQATRFIEEAKALPDSQKNAFYKGMSQLMRDQSQDTVVLPNYPVPMQGLGTIACHVVNPYIACSMDEMAALLNLYRTAMRGDDLSVVVKRQNTERFLVAAQNYMTPGFTKFLELFSQLRKQFST